MTQQEIILELRHQLKLAEAECVRLRADLAALRGHDPKTEAAE
jgi:hypothetical protein